MTWRFEAAATVTIEGRFWRMLSPRWAFNPLSGEGAARVGGRWNAPGKVALYLSEDHGTAVAEYQQDLPRPGTLTAFEVSGASILDLDDARTVLALGLAGAFMRQPWKRARDVEQNRPESWDFATAACAAGCDGLRLRSVVAPGRNLVLWRWNGISEPVVRYVDPLGDLPRDQASWSR